MQTAHIQAYYRNLATLPHSRKYALDAIGRLNAKRTGLDRFDAWIDCAVRQWRNYLTELEAPSAA